ncbi:hypothetical protein Tco_0133730, partial [Tanacetum coccineum]
KEQVKEQVSKILPKIKKFVNDQLEAEVLNRSSNQAKTSHAKTIYNALVDAYETNKDILEIYGHTITFKRRQNDEDEDEEPSARSNRGSKRRRAGKEPESTSAPKEKTSKSTDNSKEGSKSYHTSSGKSAQAEEPIHAYEDMKKSAHQEFDTGFTEDQPIDATTQHPDCTLARNEDPHKSFNELIDTPLDFSTFVMNRLKVDTLTLELLAGPTYKLMKVNRESACDVYSKHRIFDVTKLKIVEWHNYKHLDWITICKNGDKLYTFKEDHYNRLRLQDIDDMFLLLVQGKLTNLNVEERLLWVSHYECLQEALSSEGLWKIFS